MRIYRLQRRASAASRLPGRSDHVYPAAMQRTEPTTSTSPGRSSSPSAGVGRVSPNPLVGAVVVKDGQVAGRGLARRLRRPARRGRRDRRRRRRRPARRDAVRLARAVLPPRAARRRAPTRSSRPASPASSSPPTTRPRRPPAAASGILRDEGVEVVVADGELAARARLLNQAFRKHARTGRPWVLFKSAMTLDGKVATRTGDSKWISGEARAGWSPTTGAPSATPSWSASAPRWPTTRSSPRASTASRRQPRRVVFDSDARLPLDSQLVRGAARSR